MCLLVPDKLCISGADFSLTLLADYILLSHLVAIQLEKGYFLSSIEFINRTENTKKPMDHNNRKTHNVEKTSVQRTLRT